MQSHISETLPHEYQKCMRGINDVLAMAWNIATKEIADDKTRLTALALINDANKLRMDLTTNGTLVMDSVKIVQNQLDYLNGMEKKLSQINNNNKRDRELEEEDNIIYDEEQQQQKNTTNGIF